MMEVFTVMLLVGESLAIGLFAMFALIFVSVILPAFAASCAAIGAIRCIEWIINRQKGNRPNA